MKKIVLVFAFVFVNIVVAFAQHYNGTMGLINIPNAEMNDQGDARIGVSYISKELMPDCFLCPVEEGSSKKEKYNSYGYSFSITPFKWVEVAYTCVLYKYNQKERHGYTAKDRHFALKLNPIREGKYCPAIALGADDFLGSTFDPETSQQKFCNFWLAFTKHFDVSGHELGVTLGGRYYTKNFNKKYNGVNGAVTYRPPLSEETKRIVQPRGVVEYDGDHINIGADALFFRHMVAQVSLTNFKGFSAGLAYQVNLFYKNKKKKTE